MSYFSYFFLLFPPAAAPAPATCYSCCSKRTSSKGNRLKSNHSQRQIPMAVKDGKASKLRPKTP